MLSSNFKIVKMLSQTYKIRKILPFALKICKLAPRAFKISKQYYCWLLELVKSSLRFTIYLEKILTFAFINLKI